jgi:hypothetical protein
LDGGSGLRRILCKFRINDRNSPKRNDMLQDQLKKLQNQQGLVGKEVALALDIKTRWNSIITMLDSFFKVIHFKAKIFCCTSRYPTV